MSMRSIQSAAASAVSIRIDDEPGDMPVEPGPTDCAAIPGPDDSDLGSIRESRGECRAAFMAHLRPVIGNADTQASVLPLDKSFYELASPIGARIAAVRVLLGAAAAGHDATKLLDLANVVHSNAVDFPFDNGRRELSMALWDEESRQWAQANGDGDAAPQARLAAYREMWDWALNPPPPLRFKGRTELSRAHGTALAGADTKKSPETPDDTLAVLVGYYSQFNAYIKSHLDRFIAQSAVLKASEAGLGRVYIEQVPRKVWAIDSIAFPSYLDDVGRPPGEWRECSSFVVQLPDMSFGFVGKAGNFKRLPEPVLMPDGALRKASVLAAYGMRRMAPITTVHSRSVDNRRGSSLKGLMAAQIKKSSLLAMQSWQETGYDASVLERVLRALAPFYQVGQRLRHDRTNGARPRDDISDVLELSVALASMGLAAAGGLKGMRATLAASGTADAAGPRAVAGAALAHGIMHSNSRAFLRAATRELVDAVVPAFSSTDIVKMSKAAALTRVKDGLTVLLRAPKAALDEVRAPPRLEGIYRVLSRTAAVDPGTSALDIQDTIDSGAAEPNPRTLFRGPATIKAKIDLPTPRPSRVRASPDDYLAECVKHAARTSRTAVVPMSLTAERSAAWRFSAGRGPAVVVSIDTSREPVDFRRLENIIKHDGERLVAERKITADALLRAVRSAFVRRDKQVFYVGGGILEEFAQSVE